jgi:hypothetical protein
MNAATLQNASPAQLRRYALDAFGAGVPVCLNRLTQPQALRLFKELVAFGEFPEMKKDAGGWTLALTPSMLN